MNRILTCMAFCFLSVAAAADDHSTVEAEVRKAVTAFNAAYEENRVDDYFEYYDGDADVFFSGARQDVAAYHSEWKALLAAGAGVEKNELSDLRVRVMPPGDIAVATYFVDYRFRAPDGEVAAAKAFESDVWRKTDGGWKVVNLHYSEIEQE